MKTIKEIRKSFWAYCSEIGLNYKPKFKKVISKSGRVYWTQCTQNDYNTDIRCTFIDYVESLCRDGVISESLANRITL